MWSAEAAVCPMRARRWNEHLLDSGQVSGGEHQPAECEVVELEVGIDAQAGERLGMDRGYAHTDHLERLARHGWPERRDENQKGDQAETASHGHDRRREHITQVSFQDQESMLDRDG